MKHSKESKKTPISKLVDWSNWYKSLLALVAWREARGEGSEGMRAVMHVIRNRVITGRYGDWDHCIGAKWQFSSLTANGDAMLTQWPDSPDPVFAKALILSEIIFDGVDDDNTEGATHFFNPHVVMPEWSKTMTKTAIIGNHIFYKEK